MNRTTFVMLTPIGHNEFLSAIVSLEKEKLKDVLQNSLAVSLRFNGSVDRNQIDNEHVLAKTINKKKKKIFFFLGLKNQTSGAQKEH